MTWRIGPAPPTRAGIGLPRERDVATSGRGGAGEHLRTRSVCSAKYSGAFSFVGNFTIPSVPWKSPPMYSRRPPGNSRPGCGPCRLAFEVTPLPFATRRYCPSGVTRTDVGYHPTGTNPSDRLLPGLPSSNPADRPR